MVAKHSSVLTNILLKAFDLHRMWSLSDSESPEVNSRTAFEKAVNNAAIKMIFKYSDKTFRPIFSKMVEWATTLLPKKDVHGRTMRLQSFYAFAAVLFDSLKSSVTSYASYILESAVDILKNVNPKDTNSKELWARVLRTLTKSFENDQDDFWQSPAHFGVIAPALVSQFPMASKLPLEDCLVPAIVELASAVDSPNHRKELSSLILKHLRSENAEVRLAAVKCQHALTVRLGADWIEFLNEMLPYITELMDDDDQAVEKATMIWRMVIEDTMGESMEDLLK